MSCFQAVHCKKRNFPHGAPFQIIGIDHVVLRAADPAALERFYLDAFGLSFEKRQGELARSCAPGAR